MRVKIITRFAVLRLSVLLGVVAVVAWQSGVLAQFDFIRLPKETRLAVERLEAAIPEPNQQMTNKAVELSLLLNNLQCTFLSLGDEVAPWLVYDQEEGQYSLAADATSERLSPEFHEAFAAFVEWHELERAPVLPCSIPMFGMGVPYGFKGQLESIVALLPESKVDVFCEALAHAAYFTWTVSPFVVDLAFSYSTWVFLGEQYPSAEDRKRIAGPWTPDFYPASLRVTSDLLLFPHLSARTPAQEFLSDWDFESKEDCVESIAAAVDLCEQLLALRHTPGADAQAFLLLDGMEAMEAGKIMFLPSSSEYMRMIYATFPR